MATHTDIVKTTSHHVVTALAEEIDFPEHLIEGKYSKESQSPQKGDLKQPNNYTKIRNTIKDFK